MSEKPKYKTVRLQNFQLPYEGKILNVDINLNVQYWRDQYFSGDEENKRGFRMFLNTFMGWVEGELELREKRYAGIKEDLIEKQEDGIKFSKEEALETEMKEIMDYREALTELKKLKKEIYGEESTLPIEF